MFRLYGLAGVGRAVLRIPAARLAHAALPASMLVVDVAGQKLGVHAREDALKLLQPGHELRIVNAAAPVPIARIFSTAAEEKKTEAKKEAKEASAPRESKEVQLSAWTQDNDLATKTRKVLELLGEDYDVHLIMRNKRGQPRSMEMQEKVLQSILAGLPGTLFASAPRLHGHSGLACQVSPKKGGAFVIPVTQATDPTFFKESRAQIATLAAAEAEAKTAGKAKGKAEPKGRKPSEPSTGPKASPSTPAATATPKQNTTTTIPAPKQGNPPAAKQGNAATAGTQSNAAAPKATPLSRLLSVTATAK
eukprot:m.109853 g.109853  ORF g.109853 m.109853 type:complete len:306 (-) comp9053_c0_seq6:239-1156(-)